MAVEDRPLNERYDVAVIGLGGMGSAALARTALRGKRAIGIDRFARGHALGSSTGESRIIRKAYFEDENYVPLLERAYELWADLERRSGATLLDLCGILLVGSSDEKGAVRRSLASARRFAIAVDELDRDDVLRRYPTLCVRPGEIGLFEHGAGMVFPERAIEAHLAVAEGAGARTRFATRVLGYDARPSGIEVMLGDGTSFVAERLIVCAGPWLGEIARELALPFEVQRNVQLWFAQTTLAYSRDAFPAFYLERPDLPAPLYGFPDSGRGVKAALHAFGESTSADELAREITAHDVAAVAEALESFMPGAAGDVTHAKVCAYTLTPDRHFVVDRHPADDRISIAGGFSGHGFKFCSVVGEILADLASTGSTEHPIEFLGLDRFR